MIKIEKVRAMNFEGAIRGMRNPLDSWDSSDSIFELGGYDYMADTVYEIASRYDEDAEGEVLDALECYLSEQAVTYHGEDYCEWAVLGPKDLGLAQKLLLSGTDHGKFMRQIFITMDITAPLYWWKEFDTYKVGTVANSCSTMHTLLKKPITKEMFSFDVVGAEEQYLIDNCEDMRRIAVMTGKKEDWRRLIQYLPSSWNQKRTVTLNFAVARAIFFSRQFHKVMEWRQFCQFLVKYIPYSRELITITKEQYEGKKFYLGIEEEGQYEI